EAIAGVWRLLKNSFARPRWCKLLELGENGLGLLEPLQDAALLGVAVPIGVSRGHGGDPVHPRRKISRIIRGARRTAGDAHVDGARSGVGKGVQYRVT